MKPCKTKFTCLPVCYNLILFLVLYFALHLLPPTSAVGNAHHLGNEMDHAALLAIQSSLIEGNPNGVLSSWNNSRHHCYWDGVTCSPKNNRVIALDLQSKGLSGPISPFIGNLSFLKNISFSNNSLLGQIPHELGRLFTLQQLDLTNNSLGGEIPTNLSACINLQSFKVANNKLEGKLPFELRALSKLQILSVGHNNFTGSLFEVIGNMSTLEVISTTYNSFTGTIPITIGKMQNLSVLDLAENKLFGTIPMSVINCSAIRRLNVGGNKLLGKLPPNIGHSLPHLVHLDLSFNQFSGLFPFSVLNQTNLEYLGLDLNNFVGRVPYDFGQLSKLWYLALCSNTLEGDISFIGTLVNSTKLEVLDVSNNHFTGVLPKSVGNLSTNLKTFSLANNRIRGEIPMSITNLIQLSALQLNKNEFIGSIPSDLGKLPNLENLFLGYNKLQGNIPDSFGNLSRLSNVHLNDNQFIGSIAPSLVSCPSLLNLDLANNNLNGTLTNGLFKGPAKFVSVVLDDNLLEGSIPPEISTQVNLQEFSASQNKLSGTLPDGLGDCFALQMLDIHGNYFQGSIPTSFNSLGSLQSVDLSRNNLSGAIPDYFFKFPLLLLNLSYNNFEGSVPTIGIFANISAIAVDGNKLCGGILGLHLPKCVEQKKKRIMSHALGLIVVILCAFVVALTISIWLYITRRGKRRVPTSSGSLRETLKVVSYGMLHKATNGFSTKNQVGVGGFGSVFRGILDGTTVAVKVLNLTTQGAEKTFMTECKTLRNVRHRNLVRIITACSSIDFQRNNFKALVYEFMSNGSLDGWLHGDGVQNLTLVQRVEIAIDVAHALNYLHHDCETPIVHCDLKPSNILIDSDMVAHVGDFGLTKFLANPRHPNQSSSIGIRGTVGYAAPEYGLGSEPSPEGDIYSYGILLLELMTGKRPTNDFFQGNYNIHTYAEASLPDSILHIVDPTLEDNKITVEFDEEKTIQAIVQRRLECMVCVVRVGIACSRHLPQARMKISDAINKLQEVRDNLRNATSANLSSNTSYI